jgi:hypothetical protein
MAGDGIGQAAPVCGRCSRPLGASQYELRGRGGPVRLCLRHALRHPPLVRRSLLICLVVGTVLTAINQGNHIAAGAFRAEFAWKVPLAYAVPYFVATTSAILNARTRLT